MAPSRYDWKIVDWDVKPQHNQPTKKKNKQKWTHDIYVILPIYSINHHYLW